MIKELTRELREPTKASMMRLRHVVRFLLGELNKGLVYEVRVKHEVTAYVDSDWAKCPKTRKSTGCVCLYVNGCLLYYIVKT